MKPLSSSSSPIVKILRTYTSNRNSCMLFLIHNKLSEWVCQDSKNIYKQQGLLYVVPHPQQIVRVGFQRSNKNRILEVTCERKGASKLTQINKSSLRFWNEKLQNLVFFDCSHISHLISGCYKLYTHFQSYNTQICSLPLEDKFFTCKLFLMIVPKNSSNTI